jgi:hypothetical protein
MKEPSALTNHFTSDDDFLRENSNEIAHKRWESRTFSELDERNSSQNLLKSNSNSCRSLHFIEEKKNKKVDTCEMAYWNAAIDQKLEHLKPKIYNRIDHKIIRLDLEWNIKKGRYRYSALTTRKLVSYDLTSL